MITPTARTIIASAHSLPMIESESVHCILTSPPYLGLRIYAGEQDVEWPTVEYAPMAGLPNIKVQGCESGCEHEWVETNPFEPRKASETNSKKQLSNRGAAMVDEASAQRMYCTKCGGVKCPLGLEPSIEMYIGHLVLCAREWRRILRKEGTLWVNVGSSYVGSANSGGKGHGTNGAPYEISGLSSKKISGLAPKNDMMVPARLALALQGDGWILRSDIAWVSPNKMPESVEDRCSKSFEHVFMLAKSPDYFFDGYAIREQTGDGKSRNCRNTWIINTAPSHLDHYAAWPPELAKRMISAGSSGHGICPQCGAPWKRIVEHTNEPDLSMRGSRFAKGKTGINGGGRSQKGERYIRQVVGWLPTCKCQQEDLISYGYPGPEECPPAPGQGTPFDPIPATVMDPFAGSGTTLKVALELGRNAIGVDISREYIEGMVEKKVEGVSGMLFAVDSV